jgi:hypothetical protein
MDQRVFWVLGTLLVFIIAVNLLTREYAMELKDEKLPLTGALKEVPKAGGVVSEAVLSTDTKRPPGILVVKRFNKPVTQGEWDKFMTDLVTDTGMLETEEGRAAMKKKAINPAQYQDTMIRLEEEEKRVEEAYGRDPGDPMLQRRREGILKMKALTKVLVEKGVVDPDAPDLPAAAMGQVVEPPGP